jgi:tetratricopeptide (TPR) repeat protein
MRRLLAVVCLSSGIVGGATGAGARLCEAQAPDSDDLVKRGRTLMTLGKHDEAERLYRQALGLNPRSFEALRALGILLDLRGQHVEARGHLDQAVRLAPSSTVRHQAMAAVALSFAFEGKLADVQRQYEALRQQQHSDGDSSGAAASARAIGRIFQEVGDVAIARKWYELGYREWRPGPDEPASEHLLWELRWQHMQARLAARERRIDQARRHLAEFEAVMQRRNKVAEDTDIYRWVAGYVAYYAKEYDRAIAELSQGNLADPFILNLIAMSYEARGDPSSARQYYRRTLESNVHNLSAAVARPHARGRLAGGSQN